MTDPLSGLVRSGPAPVDACLNWNAYTVPTICESAHGEDDPRGWEQVRTWMRVTDAVRAQRDRLVACREAIVRRWPPQESEAAAAFVARLDELSESMTAAGVAASANTHALWGVMETLATAKRELEPIHREYRKKSTDLTLASWDGAEDALNQRAREVMARAEAAVRDYSASFAQMERMRWKDVDSIDDFPNTSLPGDITVPPLTRGSGAPASTGLPGSTEEFGLAGSSSAGAAQPSAIGGPGPTSALAPAGVHAWPLIPKSPTTPFQPAHPGVVGKRSAPPSGWVIGGGNPAPPASGSGLARPGPGGVIGGAAQGSSTGTTRTAVQPPGVPIGTNLAGGGRPARGEGTTPTYRAADVQWKGPVGVPPVIDTPPAPKPHDPGPGKVIGQ
ncbi:hypothetical protein [Pilimelia columellifera]|uniref:PPE family domain-containing protein n=1 Tax=Pilimelia columellifera subsp. columellifera TaxID=706583 RepID=A0ABN3N8G8_9ACTN